MDLKKILSEASKILQEKAERHLLPDDEALLEQQARGPGKHVHDDNNPLGVHRHYADEPLDGAHIHTPQNPGGVHVHGEKAGQPMTRNDGWHTHEDGKMGSHYHDRKDSGDNIPVRKPSDSA